MKIFLSIFFLVALASSSSADFSRSALTKKAFFYEKLRTSPFVVNGNPVRIEDFPWHLGLLDLSWGGYICGASNISPNFAISAAHCLDFETPATHINLWGGSTSRFTGGRIFFVSRYVNHPQYTETRWNDQFIWDNDVSILHIDPNTPLSGFPNVSPIQLPPVCNAPSICCTVCSNDGGSMITVAGWGIYNMDTRQLPENLHAVDKPISDHLDCNASWGRLLTARTFCTAIIDGRDSCNGDSGSAIIRNGIQVGLVSFGSVICGDGSRPAVYARLEDPILRNFITQQTGL